MYLSKITKIVLSANDDKRIQLIDSMQTYAYHRRRYLVCKKEEMRCYNVIKQCKNVKFWWCYKRNHERV